MAQKVLLDMTHLALGMALSGRAPMTSKRTSVVIPLLTPDLMVLTFLLVRMPSGLLWPSPLRMACPMASLMASVDSDRRYCSAFTRLLSLMSTLEISVGHTTSFMGMFTAPSCASDGVLSSISPTHVACGLPLATGTNATFPLTWLTVISESRGLSL